MQERYHPQEVEQAAQTHWNGSGAFRAIYVARFAGTIYVLHCFQKKTAKTGRNDIDLARRRYNDLRKEIAR